MFMLLIIERLSYSVPRFLVGEDSREESVQR